MGKCQQFRSVYIKVYILWSRRTVGILKWLENIEFCNLILNVQFIVELIINLSKK